MDKEGPRQSMELKGATIWAIKEYKQINTLQLR